MSRTNEQQFIVSFRYDCLCSDSVFATNTVMFNSVAEDLCRRTGESVSAQWPSVCRSLAVETRDCGDALRDFLHSLCGVIALMQSGIGLGVGKGRGSGAVPASVPAVALAGRLSRFLFASLSALVAGAG